MPVWFDGGKEADDARSRELDVAADTECSAVDDWAELETICKPDDERLVPDDEAKLEDVARLDCALDAVDKPDDERLEGTAELDDNDGTADGCKLDVVGSPDDGRLEAVDAELEYDGAAELDDEVEIGGESASKMLQLGPSTPTALYIGGKRPTARAKFDQGNAASYIDERGLIANDTMNR